MHYIYILLNVYVNTHTGTYINRHLYAYTYTYTFIHTPAHTYTYAYISICTHAYSSSTFDQTTASVAAMKYAAIHNNNNNNNNDNNNNNVNNNNNNNSIQRCNCRFLTISSLRRELSPTRTLKWPGVIMCKPHAFHVQHVVLRATWYEVCFVCLLSFLLNVPFHTLVYFRDGSA